MLRLTLWPILVNVPCTHELNMKSTVTESMLIGLFIGPCSNHVHACKMYVYICTYTVYVSASSVIERSMFKSSPRIVVLSISPLGAF